MLSQLTRRASAAYLSRAARLGLPRTGLSSACAMVLGSPYQRFDECGPLVTYNDIPNTGSRTQYASLAAQRVADKSSVILVGAGRMGKLRYELMEGSSNVSCAGIVESQAAIPAIADSFSVPFFTDLPAALSEKKDVDGVWITTPTSSHIDLIKCAADHGKHVYCEKPISFTREQIQDTYDYCASRNVKLHCGWMKRFDPEFQQVKSSSETDKWHHVNFVNRDNPLPEAALMSTLGDYWSDCVSHEVNLSLWFAGEKPLSVYSQGTKSFNDTAIDHIHSILEFSGGRFITIENTRFSPDEYDQRVEVSGQHKHRAERPAGENGWSFPQRFRAAFANEVEYFGGFLKHPDSTPNRCPPQDCLDGVDVVTALRRSYFTGRKVMMEKLDESDEESRTTIAVIDDGSGGVAGLVGGLPALFQASAEPGAEAVYVGAGGDAAAVACLSAGQHALVPPPLVEYDRVMACAQSTSKVLMLAFPRRFDPSMQRLRAAVERRGPASVKYVLQESADGLPEDGTLDAAAAISERLVHDLDLLQWLFPNSLVQVTGLEALEGAIAVRTSVQHRCGAVTEAELSWRRGGPTAMHRVSVDGEVFGGELAPGAPDASTAQLRYFHSLVTGQRFDNSLLSSYQKTFQLVNSCLAAIGRQ